MQRWGLSLDIVTCIALQISVGLCVDYAAHVGHTFLNINQGSRKERALETVLQIGPAVLYGATSTLLAFSVLGAAESYSFTAFFKVSCELVEVSSNHLYSIYRLSFWSQHLACSMD
jgi:Niemann-Pick C1 protein